MTSGRHAIFLIKISTNLPLDVHGRLPGGFIVPSLQNASAAVTEALEAVFVLRAGALQVHGAAVEEKHLLFNARVYNAIMLATYAIRRAHTRGVHIDGYTVATYAQNVTFNGLHSIVTTNERAEVLLEFNLWDYRSESANFEVVLEFSKDLSNIKSRSAIRWPGGVALEGDACKFEECVAGIRDIETG
ncbi:hypothetical protein LSAT2_026860 [Lamellibrachia satsuma]|nr:hypothetical protein LSAT2_026860 [Lamellibrachia satsuma]